MQTRYEYRFVPLKGRAKSKEYQSVVRDHASEGWRLVQVFAPGAGGLWASANFCEVIFERPVG
jgi:hypothetical protein